MSDIVKAALIAGAALIISALLNVPVYSSRSAKDGVYVVNSFTGSVKFCGIYRCNPTTDDPAGLIR